MEERAATELRGICLACCDGPTCPHARGRMVIECERFHPFVPVAPHGEPHPLLRRAAHLGLCASCTLVDDCGRERPESGIWHCESYQGEGESWTTKMS